eukprot:scaffold279180_cov21-Tisochrysis_lutea.AAC.3
MRSPLISSEEAGSVSRHRLPHVEPTGYVSTQDSRRLSASASEQTGRPANRQLSAPSRGYAVLGAHVTNGSSWQNPCPLEGRCQGGRRGPR